MRLSAEELIAGSALTYEAEVPAALLAPGKAGAGESGTVLLRPLTVRDLQLVARAAQENDDLASVLTVQRAIREPELTVQQVASMPAGLVQHLLGRALEISGLETDAERLRAAAGEPLVKAAHVLAKEFGWTPDEVHALTLGQILLHLELLRAGASEERGAARKRAAGG